MKKIIVLLIILNIFVANSLAYSDGSDYLWAVPAVNRWKDKGIITGYTDGTFKGNNNITRADLVIIANRLNNSVEKNNKRVALDILENDYFFNDVCTAVNKGLIKVDDNNNFRPREYATREDAMIVFSTLFNLNYGGNSYEYLTKKFSDGEDVEVSNLNKIAGFVDAGFITGYKDGTLRPKNNITRAELIAMLDKAIADIYKEGNYSNNIINGSIVINDKNVRIKNSEINGRVFILDGAKDNLPQLINTNATYGIISRVGQVTIEKGDKFETATEYKEDKTFNEAVLGYFKYDKTEWTNKDVKATLKLDDGNYEVINNNGKKYYEFEKNGEFTFECEKDGNIKRFTATVNNIDKVEPSIKAEIMPVAEGVNISFTISDDKLSPLKVVAYTKGDVSGKNAILGTKLENNTFSVSEAGSYTIAAQDEAGNIGRLVINTNNSIYTVSFNANGGVGEMSPQVFIKDFEKNLELNKFTNVKGVFKGWATTSAGTVIYTDGQSIKPTSNMTLYAVWELNKYKITVTQSQNGTISPETIDVTYEGSQKFSIVPNANYKISEVLIDGVSIGAVSEYTFENVTDVHTITAVYVEDVPSI